METNVKKIHSLEMVLDMFKVLADNEYSLLWDLVDDFEINGHVVSVKDSHQFKQVIIDGRYEHIGGVTIQYEGTTCEPLDYIRIKLSNQKQQTR